MRQIMLTARGKQGAGKSTVLAICKEALKAKGMTVSELIEEVGKEAVIVNWDPGSNFK